MNFSKCVVFIILGGLAAGCRGSQGEFYFGTPGSPAWFATAAPETVAGYFSRRCASYGFPYGSSEMSQCVQEETRAARMRNTINSAAFNLSTATAKAAHRK